MSQGKTGARNWQVLTDGVNIYIGHIGARNYECNSNFDQKAKVL